MNIADMFAQGWEHEERLRQQRYQNELLHFEAEQRERERQANLAKQTMQETMADIANGTPAEAAVARARALYKAHGIDASPSIKPRDQNHPEGGGYEFHGFLPGQDEPIVADPRAQRERAAAIRAAGIATVMGENPEAQGLLPPVQQRALQTPEGQAFMGRMGGMAGQAVGGAMGGGGGLEAIAGAAGGAAGGSQAQATQMADQNLAPTDAATAVAHQAALAGDEQTLAMMQRLAEARGRYMSQQDLEAMKQRGLNQRAAERRASALEVTMKRLEAKRAGGGGISLKDIETLRKDYSEHKGEYKSAEDSYQKTLNEWQQAQQPKVAVGADMRPVVIPPNPAAVAEIGARLATLKGERDSLARAVDTADQRYGKLLEARYGKKGEKRPGKQAPAAEPVVKTPELQVVKVKAKTRVEFTGGPNRGRKATLLPGEPFDPATMKTIE